MVGVEHGLRVEIGETLTAREYAGIVDEDVEGLGLGPHGIGRGLNAGVIGDIDGDEMQPIGVGEASSCSASA
jgi:hypothetical protein